MSFCNGIDDNCSGAADEDGDGVDSDNDAWHGGIPMGDGRRGRRRKPAGDGERRSGAFEYESMSVTDEALLNGASPDRVR